MPAISFYANFDDFSAAVATASDSLKTFELSTKGVQGQLTRLSKAFDGSQITRDATLTVAAVEKIGGASKLTEAEQRKVNATLTQALEKYRALGQEAPDALVRMARATDQNERAFQGLKGAMATAVGTFAGFVSAQAVFAGLKTAVAGVGAVMSSAFATNASLEKTTLQFSTLMGSAEQARVHVKSLFDFAKATPFETGPIIEASRSLQVFGGAALNSQANLTLIGDAAAATGAPIDELSSWVGKLYASLASGRPIGDATARLTELGVIGPQARAALEAAAAGGGTLEQKFGVLKEALGQFTGAMQLQAGTWDGVMSSLADTVNLTLADAFRELYESVRDSMGNVVTILGSDGVTGALEAVGRAVLNAFGTEQASQVAGMTRAFVAIGQGASMAAEVAIRAWGAVKAAVFGVLAAINVENSRVMNTLAAMPLIGSQFREAAIYAEGFAASLVNDYEAAKQNMTGQSELVKSLQRLRTELDKAATDAIEMARGTKSAGDAAGGAAPKNRALGDAFQAVGTKIKDTRTAYDRWVESLTRGVVATNNQVNALNALARAYDIAADARTRGGGFGVEVQGRSSYLGNQISLGGLPGTTRMGEVGAIGNAISMGGLPSAQTSNGFAWQRQGINWGGILSQLPAQLANVFASGGSSRQVGGGLGSLAGGLGGTLASSSLGFAAGSFMGSAIPVIGTLIGGFLGKQLGGLFGPSRNAQLTQQANAGIAQTQSGLLNQYGSVQNIAGMNVAGQELAAAWGSRGVAGQEHFNRLVGEFNAMLEQQNSLMSEQETIAGQILDLEGQRARLAESLIVPYSEVQRIAQEYGLTLGQMGGTIAQMGTTEGFMKVVNDLETLDRAAKQAGGSLDYSGTLDGMSKRINELLAQSKKYGTAIPENMRPFLETLLKNGQLLDENGQKLTSLGNIKWGPKVETEAEKTTAAIDALDSAIADLKTAFQEIADQLRSLLPAAAQEGAAGVERAFAGARPRITVDVEYNESGQPTSRPYDNDPRMATGGIVRYPTRAVIGEAGPEAVIPLSGNALRDFLPSAGPIRVELAHHGRVFTELVIDNLRGVAVARGLA